MKYARLVALAGSVLALTQIFLLAGESDGICFNDGCQIVDSLTTVPPIVINIGGFFFFQAVFWGIWLAREKRERLLYVNILLLAGLAAEGVLVSFQHFVAEIFCSYCLLVLAHVIVLNLLAGLRQIFKGAVVFFTVLAAFTCLQFIPSNSKIFEQLESGSYATLSAGKQGQKSYLFFSSTCKHCEKVIEWLGQENNCVIGFNPIDSITDFSLQGAEKRASYATEVNRKVLSSFGLEEVPVLLAIKQSGFQVIKGENPIKEFLDQYCGIKVETPPAPVETFTGVTRINEQSNYLPPGLDESCSVNSGCEDPSLIPQTN